MKNLKQSFSLVSLTLLLSVSLAPPSYSLDFPDTGDRGAPSSTAGGGTRGGWCDAGSAWWDETSLFALVPKNNVSTFVGDKASLWIHLGPIFSQKRAELFVQHAQTKEVVYRQELTLGAFDSNLIMQLDLPAIQQESGEPLLNKNEEYSWEFAVICDSGDRARDYYINGLMQPVEADAALSAQLANADSAEVKAELYANAGIWQETMMLAQELSESQPDLLTALLASVGLETSLAQSLSQ